MTKEEEKTVVEKVEEIIVERSHQILQEMSPKEMANNVFADSMHRLARATAYSEVGAALDLLKEKYGYPLAISGYQGTGYGKSTRYPNDKSTNVTVKN